MPTSVKSAPRSSRQPKANPPQSAQDKATGPEGPVAAPRETEESAIAWAIAEALGSVKTRLDAAIQILIDHEERDAELKPSGVYGVEGIVSEAGQDLNELSDRARALTERLRRQIAPTHFSKPAESGGQAGSTATAGNRQPSGSRELRYTLMGLHAQLKALTALLTEGGNRHLGEDLRDVVSAAEMIAHELAERTEPLMSEADDALVAEYRSGRVDGAHLGRPVIQLEAGEPDAEHGMIDGGILIVVERKYELNPRGVLATHIRHLAALAYPDAEFLRDVPPLPGQPEAAKGKGGEA